METEETNRIARKLERLLHAGCQQAGPWRLVEPASPDGARAAKLANGAGWLFVAKHHQDDLQSPSPTVVQRVDVGESPPGLEWLEAELDFALKSELGLSESNG